MPASFSNAYSLAYSTNSLEDNVGGVVCGGFAEVGCSVQKNFSGGAVAGGRALTGYGYPDAVGEGGAVCGSSAKVSVFTATANTPVSGGAVVGGTNAATVVIVFLGGVQLGGSSPIDTSQHVSMGGVECWGVADVVQRKNCRRSFRQYYPRFSKFDYKYGTRTAAYLPTITACQQGLNELI